MGQKRDLPLKYKGKTGNKLNKVKSLQLKLSDGPKITDGFKIVYFEKLLIIFFSLCSLLVAYLLSRAFSIPNAEI